MVLLILVLQDGSVKQEMLTLAQTLTQDALDDISRRLSNACENLSAESVNAVRPTLPMFEAEIAGVVADILQHTERAHYSPVYRDGLAEVLKQPEFERREESETLLRVMEEHSSLLEEVFANALSMNVGGVQVVIGGEGRWRELRDCSLVLGRYGVPDQAMRIWMNPDRMASLGITTTDIQKRRRTAKCTVRSRTNRSAAQRGERSADFPGGHPGNYRDDRLGSRLSGWSGRRVLGRPRTNCQKLQSKKEVHSPDEFRDLVSDLNGRFSMKVSGTPLWDPEIGSPFAILSEQDLLENSPGSSGGRLLSAVRLQ
jgi:hypothetical protein